MSFRERKKIQNIVYSKLSIFILLILIFIVARGVLGVYGDSKLTDENEKVAIEQLQELKDREREILNKISDLKTVEGREREIRSKFRVAKEGEKMIMIIDENNSNYSNTKTDKTFWVKTREFFGF